MKKQVTYSERNERDGKLRYKLWTKILIINLLIQSIIFYILPIYFFGFNIAGQIVDITSTYQLLLFNFCYYIGVALGCMMMNGYIHRKLIIMRT